MWKQVFTLTCASLADKIYESFIAILFAPWKKFTFMTAVDKVSTNKAIDYIRTHGTSTGSFIDGDKVHPNGFVFGHTSYSPWAASIQIEAGERRWGEEMSVTMTVYWPVWVTLPDELVLINMVDEPIGKGSVHTLRLAHCASHYCAWKKELSVLNIGRCPMAAFLAAKKMQLHLNTGQGPRIFYVNGPPDKGKTTAGRLLAYNMGGMYVDSFDFTDSEQSIELLLRDAQPSFKSPLIIGVGEGGMRILNTLRAAHGLKKSATDDDGASAPSPTFDKGKLCTLFDLINYDLPNVTMVISDNQPFKQWSHNLASIFQKKDRPIEDMAITKPSRMYIVNVGGDAECDR